MDEILKEFQDESKVYVAELADILEEVEENIENNQKLEKFGQVVDRIMGAAKTLEGAYQDESLKHISSYSELCKLIGYKASQLKNQPEFCAVVVAFLLDATEMLDELIENVGSAKKTSQVLTATFLSRLQMISGRFDSSLRGSVGVEDKASTQSEIDELLKKMGL